MYGYIWVFMGMYRYICVCVGIYGYIQVYRYCQVEFFLEIQGVFFEFDFWLLKISKLNFESEFPLLGGSIDLRPPYRCFWFCGILKGLFLVWFLIFKYFGIEFWIRIPTFGMVCFIKLFDFRPPYICFWFFGI